VKGTEKRSVGAAKHATRRVGILGGSFDPVHIGHIAAAEAARDVLDLDEVLLVPAASSPHKPGGPHAGAEDRFAMVLLACRGRRGLVAEDLELHRPPPSYTIDTVRELQHREPETRWVLLLGADALSEFPRWRAASAIAALAEVAVITRPGAPVPVAPRPASADAAGESAEVWPRILYAATPDVSSSEVRRRVAAGLPVIDLVPDDVEAYIAARGLYAAARP
jgi:nicotinate-nucleotide adenylyltransferase